MAATINSLNINGKLVSWSHVRFTLGGDLFTGFTKLAFDEKLERSYGYGATKAHAPIGVSEPKYSPGTLKITGHVHAIQELRTWFMGKAEDGKSYGCAPPQPGLLQWDLGAGAPELSAEFVDLQWDENATSAEENPDPEQEDIVLRYRLCKRNGGTLYNSSDEA